MVRALCLCFAALLTGCLYTSHHFNTGRLLDPGVTRVTAGMGLQPYVAPTCDDEFAYLSTDSVDAPKCVTYHARPDSAGSNYDTSAADTRPSDQYTYSFGYRLGVRGKWGPFTGV